MFNWNPVKNIDYIIDYYHILNISIESSQNEIKQSYKKLAKEYHPDKFQKAGDEIKVLSSKKMDLISEAYEILSDLKIKEIYDKELALFKKEKPKSISTDGNPIVNLSTESYSIDFILSDHDKFSFQEEQEKKIDQLTNFNEAVFNIVEEAYLKNENDDKTRDAYLQQLISKKVYLDLKEMTALQEMGVLNPKEISSQRALDYSDSIKKNIDSISKKVENLIEVRLLDVKQSPLRIGTSREIKSQIKQNDIENIKKDLLNKINQRSKKLLSVSKEKQEVLLKLVRLRVFKKINNIESKEFKVFLYDKNNMEVITGFLLTYDEDIPKDIILDKTMDKKNVSELKENISTYILEFNKELNITLQIVEFINDVLNDEL